MIYQKIYFSPNTGYLITLSHASLRVLEESSNKVFNTDFGGYDFLVFE